MASVTKRITIFNGSIENEGRLFLVPETHRKLMSQINRKLTGNIDRLFTEDGALIDDVDVIRDGDILFACEVGKKFIANESFSAPGKMHSSVKNVNTGLQQQSNSDWIKLNVGGQIFVTTRSTLVTNAPESMLARMFSSEEQHPWCSSVDSDGAFLIDRSPFYFEPILNYLRHGELVLDKNMSSQGVLEEARFFGIQKLVEILEVKVKEDQPPTDSGPFTRREFVKVLMSTSTNTELRCQGVNFSGIDLSKLDLRNINFKCANLKGANLSGANLTECNFERADLSQSKLDNANMLGVRMLCVNLEAASMKGCNFEDPAGKQAYLEGANLKFVNLEGSHMAGVNLRVATLRKANLQNCDLRGAIMAGADLEDADLTGSDLQEANLRGANLNGAYLELIVNPLHMSQTIR